ncbi:MAG: hypothetical protein ACEQSA_05930 [Weeksellaceae bacterium]
MSGKRVQTDNGVFSTLNDDLIGVIKALGRVTVEDVFSPASGNAFVFQNPPIAQNWIGLETTSTIPTFQWATDGNTEYFLNIGKNLNHMQELICDFTMTFADPTGGTAPAFAPLGPYFWFYNYRLIQGSTIIYPYIDPIYLYHFFFSRLKNELRIALFATASDQTVYSGVAQTIVLPMPMSRLLSGIERPALPTGGFSTKLVVNFKPRAITNFTINGSATTTAVMNNLNFYSHSGFYESSTSHSHGFFVGMEMPIWTSDNEKTMVANTSANIKMMSAQTGVAKSVYFLFQATTDTAVNVRAVFKGGMPTAMAFHPGGANAMYTINGAGQIKMLQISNWYEMNLYNTVSSPTIVSTYTTCLNYPFGPKYTVADLLSSYYNIGTVDTTFMEMTFAVAGRVIPLMIMYQILRLNANGSNLEFVNALM